MVTSLSARTAAELRVIHVGTSGWHYRHWVGPFYPAGTGPARMLQWYTRHLDAVELNNSFYRLPSAAAFTAWKRAVPPGFRFAVKASRFITHMKKLKDPEEALGRFLPLVELLGPALGPVLFQLPPRWRCDQGRLAAFLGALPRRHRYAFELRDPSWLQPGTYRLLQEHRAALCIYDLAGFQSPLELTTDFSYVRLHGPGGKYQGSYSEEQLRTWAQRVCSWQRHLHDVYVFFDNDQSGFAAANALALRRLTGG